MRISDWSSDVCSSDLDWTRISTGLRARIDARIAALTRTRGLLDQCIGCGCLSLKKCGLYNREDKAAQRGAGPRYVIGDRAGEIAEIDRKSTRMNSSH